MGETLKPEANRLDWRTVLKAGDDTPPNVIAAFDAYFKPFAEPVTAAGEEGALLCINCGKALTGFSPLLMGGGFEWGLVHGEGHCAACGWPARAHHYIKDTSGADLATLRNVVLQYHPDEVTPRAKATA